MAYLHALNKRLSALYKGRVQAFESSGCLHLTGELDDWQQIVEAGLKAVNKKKYIGLVNEIKLSGREIPPMKLPPVSDNTLEGVSPDVLIIGGGIVGCAIARELRRYAIDVMLAEKEHDVAVHASSRNDGMIHPGIDLKKGELKKKYNDIGNAMMGEICADLDVPYKKTGQYLCFAHAWMKPVAAIAQLYWKALKVPVKYVGRASLKRSEPHLSDALSCALHFPTAGVVCPYGLTVAYAENAADNGAQICLETAVIGMDVSEGHIRSVLTNRGRVYPRLVVNAAGVFSEEIAKLAHDHFFSIHPRKGTNIILDKKAGYLVTTIASSLASVNKSGHSKGGGIVHTVDGNLLVGPNAAETYERETFDTDRDSVKKIFETQQLTCPDLSEKDIITYFTGVRAAAYEEDFIIGFGKFTDNIIHAAGIQSPGLTAAPAIAFDIAQMAAKFLDAKPNEAFCPVRKGIVRTAAMPPVERNVLIRRDPDYGVIVCRCEEISRGEIRDALHRSVPCDSVDGVKRRVRAGMGRCQSGFCGPTVAQIIARELNISVEQVRKSAGHSELLLGSNKEDA